MTLPNHLAERVESLRQAVERVDGLSVRTLAEDSQETLAEICNLVAECEMIQDDLSEALIAIEDFAQVYQQKWQIGPAGKGIIDLMRHAALAHVDGLATLLAGTKPSAEARALGLG